MRFRKRPGLERRQQNDDGKRHGEQKEKPKGSDAYNANSRNVQPRARHHNEQARENSVIAFAKPRRHLLQINHEQRGVNGHVKNTGRERQPSFLKAPEISKATPHPCIVAALVRQRARKLTDHKCRGQAPKARQEQEDQNSKAIARAMNNLFGPIGAAGHHEKRRRNQRPECQLRCSLFCYGKCLGGNLGGNRYAAQFLLSSSSSEACSRISRGTSSQGKNTKSALSRN